MANASPRKPKIGHLWISQPRVHTPRRIYWHRRSPPSAVRHPLSTTHTAMDSTNSAKKRKVDCDLPLPSNANPSTVLSFNLSLADLNRIIDQRVDDAVESKAPALSSRVNDLRRENKGLLLRCESLERSVKVLRKEGNWTYSAPDVPRSHWIEQGHDGEYADEAENLIQSIKTSTPMLRSAGGSVVSVRGRTQSPILSDNVLYPHWEELADAIQLSERIMTLNLVDVQLDQRTLQIIETSAREKGVKGVTLSCNQFHGGEGVQFAIDVLNRNRSVERFYWEDNAFHTTEHACDLIDAILEHPTVNDLELTGCSLNEIIIPLQRLFGGAPGTDILINIYLSGNRIRTNGNRCIPDFLSTNPPLKTLDLNDNQLTDDDALHIALALQSNTNLRYLYLGDNALTKHGKSVMINQAIFGADLVGVKSVCEIDLNTVSEANHTCKIEGISGPKDFMNFGHVSAKSNRGRKMFRLLRRGYREGCIIPQLESEFSENAMVLVPHVFSCINDYSRDFCRSFLS